VMHALDLHRIELHVTAMRGFLACQDRRPLMTWRSASVAERPNGQARGGDRAVREQARTPGCSVRGGLLLVLGALGRRAHHQAAQRSHARPHARGLFLLATYQFAF
jgi:hypothetical protein